MNDKLKILWFCNTPSLAEEKLSSKPTGGGWIKSLEAELKKNSTIDLSIAFYYSKELKPFEHNGTTYYPIYLKKKNPLINYLRRVFNIISSKGEIEIFLSIVENVKPDLIHIHGTELAFGLIQKYTKIPVVISIQGNLNVYQWKYFSGISKQAVKLYSKIKKLLLIKDYNYYYRQLSEMAIREKEILNDAKFIIGRTKWDKRICSILAPNSHYFHNDEILRNTYYYKEWDNHLSETVKIFTTSGTALYKGIETIIAASALLDNYNIKYRWEIAGLNEKDDLVLLFQKSLHLGSSKNISYLGNLTEIQIADKIMESHIYVMPSHIENSPNSLCEALIMGIPCISTFAGGSSSLLNDNEEGFLIQDGDPYSLAGSIIEMTENYSFAKEMGKKARLRALKRHDREKINLELVEIYNSIIK